MHKNNIFGLNYWPKIHNAQNASIIKCNTGDNLTLYLHLLHFGAHLLQGFFVFFLLCIAMWWSFESQLMMARNTHIPPTSLFSQGLAHSASFPFLPSFCLPFFAVQPVIYYRAINTHTHRYTPTHEHTHLLSLGVLQFLQALCHLQSALLHFFFALQKWSHDSMNQVNSKNL